MNENKLEIIDIIDNYNPDLYVACANANIIPFRIKSDF